MVDPLHAHQRAQAVFAAALSRVVPEQIDAPTPCAEWSVRDLVDHVVAGNERIAGTGASAQPRDLTGLVEAHAASAAAAQAAFASPGGLERQYPFRTGPIPGSVAVEMRARDVLVHAWDLARATGQRTDLDPELSGWALESSRQFLTDALRGPGRPFAPEQPCDPGRPAADRLAAFLGRRVE